MASLRTPILVGILPDLVTRSEPAGVAILSGILERELSPFLSLLRRYPLEIVDTKTIGGWVTLTSRRADKFEEVLAEGTNPQKKAPSPPDGEEGAYS